MIIFPIQLIDVPGMKRTSGQKNHGEVLLTGPQVVDVRYNNNISMDGLDEDGWLHTGR